MLTSCEDELVLNNFLSILAKDIENCPQNLVPMTVEKFMKISSLVEDIKIDLGECLKFCVCPKFIT